MTIPLRVLLVNKSEDEARPVIKELQEAGYTVNSQRVDTPEKLTAAIKKQTWDIILADTNLPNFNGLQILRTSRNYAPEIPVVFITENLTWDNIGTLMEAGANSCTSKKELKRLIPVIKRELGSAELRKEYKTAEQQIIFQSKLASESPDPILRVGRDGVIQYHNKASSPLLLSWQSSLGKPLPAKWQRLIKEVYESGINKTTEIEYKDKNFLLNIVPVKDADYVNIYAIDITEQEKAKEALHESEEKYRSIVENTTDAILLTIPDGQILSANPAAERIFGRSEKEICQIGRNGIIDVTDPRLPDALKKREITGKFEGELTFLRKDGSKFPGEITSTLFTDSEGNKRTSMFIRDITERKQAEKALKESEEKFRTLFETMAQGVVYEDAKGKITSANPAAERILGLTLDQLQGRTSVDPRWRAIHEDGSDFPGETHPVSVALKTGKPVSNVVMGVFNPLDGKHHWILINATPQFHRGENQPYQAYTTFEDITERTLAEEKRKEIENRFRELFDNIETCVAVYEPVENGDNFIIKDINKAAERTEKVKKEDIVGKLITDIFPGVIEFGIFGALQRVWRTGKPEHLPVSFYKDGRISGWRENYIYKLPSETIVASYEDITERMQTEEALLESENKYHNLAERANDGICIIQNMQIVYSNQRLAQMWGGSAAELVGKQIIDFIHPDSLNTVLNNYKLRMAGKEVPQLYEVFLKRKDGTKLYVELNAGVIVYAEKTADLVMVRDISERKKAEERLADSERTLKAAQTLGKIGSWVKDIITGQITWSDELYELYERDKTLGPADSAEMDSYLTPEDNKKVQEAVQFALETGQIFRTDIIAHRPNGKTVYQSHTFSPVKDENGKITKFMGIIQDITERKKAEERLADSERTLKAAQTLGRIGSWVTDIATQQITWSDELYDICERDKTLGPPSSEEMSSFYTPEDNQKLQEAIQIALETGQVFRTDLTAHLPNGKTVFQHIAVSPVRDENGKITKFLGIIQDITERKEAEEQVRFQAQLLDSAIDAVFVHDLKDRFIYANDAASQLYGYSREEFLNSTLDLVVTKENRGKISNNKQNVIDKRQHNFEAIHERKDGSLIPVEIHSQRIEWSGQTLVLSVVRDITERKKAEESLEKSERRYRTLFESASEGISIVDSDTRKFKYANPAFCKMLGYRNEEIIGMKIEQTHPENAQPDIINTFNNAVKVQDTTRADVLPLEKKDGTIIYVSITTTGTEIDGNPSVIAFSTDVTEREKTTAALKESEQRLKEAQSLGKIANYEVDVNTTRGIWSEEMYNLFERDKNLPAPDAKEIQVYFTPEEYKKYDKITRTAIDENRKAEGDVIARLPSGKTPVFHISCLSVRNAQGKIARVFGTIQDITERKKAEDELKKSYTRMSKILDGIISAMAATIEIRDPYTAGHQQQVAKLAGAIAEELGLAEDTINAIYTAGVIHDIGKIGIPADILSKPGKLNQIEYALIKAHAQIGSDVLKNIDFPFPLAKWVLEHHERLDGSGYPAGLKDGEISREAKILAIADVVESMISHRPYRPSLGIDAALEEINKNKGKLYDAEAVAACTRLFKEKAFHF